jgi:hypothetical protein
MKNIDLFILVMSSLVYSCVRPEISIPKHSAGDINTGQVTLGKSYMQQVYFDITTNSIISQNNKQNWDLSSEISSSGNHVFLNSSKARAVAPYDNKPFRELMLEDDDQWLYDSPTGHLDSTAISDWQNKPYLIDRGYSLEGDKIGYCKISIKLDQNQDYLIDVQIQYEPKKHAYDLLFTQYTHVFSDQTTYLVTRALSNPDSEIALVDEVNFASISMSDINKAHFSNAKNSIGYDWKFYSYDEGIYIIFPEKNYIIKTDEGVFYKFHFIGY